MTANSGPRLSDRLGPLVVSFILATLLARWLLSDTWGGACVYGCIGVIATVISWPIEAWQARLRAARERPSSPSARRAS